MVRKLILLLVFVFSVSLVLEAQKKSNMNSAKKEQQATQRKIDETSKKIKQNNAETQKNLNKLHQLQGEIDQKNREISRTRQVIDSLDATITIARDSVSLLNDNLARLEESYRKAMRGLQGSQQATNELGFIFSSESFSKAYARLRYMQEFARWRKRKSDEILAARGRVADKEARLSSLQSDRLSELSKLNNKQSDLKAQQTETDLLVTTLQQNKKELQNALAAEKKRLKSINDDINRMLAEEKREHENKKKQNQNQGQNSKNNKGKNGSGSGNGNSSKPSGPSKPGTTKIDNSDPDAQMTAKFEAAKGSMLFPVSGSYTIVSKYGSSGDANSLQSYNTGIEVLLNGGNTARSIFEGTVSRIFQNHDGNYTIMVRHGAYITVFYNIASASVKAKQNVSAGQTIGTVSNDARYGKPMLHFEIRKGSATLNPTSWIR